MRIWLDDQYEERKGWFSPEWVHCRWPAEVIEKLKAGGVEEISLDHDLGDEDTARREDRREITGYDVMLWIEEQVFTNKYIPPVIAFHSKNGVGVERMKRSWDAIYKFFGCH